MKVNYYSIGKDFKRIEKIFFHKAKSLLYSGNYILGENLLKFESKIKKLLKCKYVLGVANGTDALELALITLNLPKGSEVITTSNTFVSTVNSIVNVGCIPVFADVDDTLNIDPKKIESLITSKTSAIIPVHLNGMPCCMLKINEIAKKYKIKIIEDCAQSILSKYNNKFVGNSNNICSFSLHPTKNLGGIGDGGFITTNNKLHYKKIKILRNHGIFHRDKVKFVGRNSRLDEINALILNLKINYLKEDTERKINIAKIYSKYLSEKILKPNLGCCKSIVHTYHRYVVRVKNRKQLIKYLKKNNIDIKVHYETSLHKNKLFKKFLKKKNNLNLTNIFSREILSLPINPFLTDKQIHYCIKIINKFYQ